MSESSLDRITAKIKRISRYDKTLRSYKFYRERIIVTRRQNSNPGNVANVDERFTAYENDKKSFFIGKIKPRLSLKM